MTVVPISLREARAFVAAHHRHSQPPRGWLFGAALEVGGEVVAVGVAGRPVAAGLQDGRTIEITRVCTLGTRNASSRLYGALCRAAAALGYRRAVTYNLRTESGSSIRAAGFTLVEELAARTSWASKGRGRYDATVWGDATLPDEPRNRWERTL
jgi:hypothetical protein